MLGVLICDDDVEFLERMRGLVEDYFRAKERKVILYTYSDAREVSTQVFGSTDIALLDIDFEDGECNGLDIARALRSCRGDSVIVFVTDFVEYAPEGYEVQALRYILKKKLAAELIPCLNMAVSQLDCARDTYKFQINGEVLNIPLADVLYFEVRQHNVTMFLRCAVGARQQKTYSFYATLTELEDRLSGHGFLRVHKSYLVNMRHIVRIQCREVSLDNGDAVRASEKNHMENKRRFLLWKGWQA